jgi:hypothetical protein
VDARPKAGHDELERCSSLVICLTTLRSGALLGYFREGRAVVLETPS